MSCLQIVDEAAPLFDYGTWNLRLSHLATQYAASQPVPHVLLPNFLASEAASQAAYEFPRSDSKRWTHYQHCNENKLGMSRRELFPCSLRAIADELNTPRFLAWLSGLTRIPGLSADPSLEGGGYIRRNAEAFSMSIRTSPIITTTQTGGDASILSFI